MVEPTEISIGQLSDNNRRLGARKSKRKGPGRRIQKVLGPIIPCLSIKRVKKSTHSIGTETVGRDLSTDAKYLAQHLMAIGLGPLEEGAWWSEA